MKNEKGKMTCSKCKSTIIENIRKLGPWIRDGSQSKKMRDTNEYMKWRDNKMKSSE